MRRRELIRLLAGMAAWRPTVAWAQRPKIIGFLNAQQAEEFTHVVRAFHRGLLQSGLVDGSDYVVEYRWGEGHYDRLPMLAEELVARRVAVIAATGGDASALAAKAATTAIPIVFTIGGDPVDLGLAENLSRPGGNLTGLTQYTAAIEAKRLELLREVVPNAGRVAMLVNPTNPNLSRQLADLPAAAQSIGLQLTVLKAATEEGIDAIFETLTHRTADALFVASDPFFNSRREQLANLSQRAALPTIFHQREFSVAGGLLSYGSSAIEMYVEAGRYVARVLGGAKPSDLPIQQPTRFELVINLRTAKALGLSVPPSLLARADEVIE